MLQPLSDIHLPALLRGSLSFFVQRTFAHLNPGVAYSHNWHIDLLADRLEQVLQGGCRRLIINVPPRSMKSIMTSVGFVAWGLGHFPNKRFICASYGQDLSDKHAEDCRNVMMSSWYQDAFPRTRLRGARPSVADFRTTLGGGRLATSVGGVLTGLGGDVIVIDDPLKPDQALSASARNEANNWLGNTVASRFDNKQTGALVVVMQRLHLDDVVGFLLEQGEEWTVISLPAIAEEEQTFHYQTLAGPMVQIRRAGDVLHPARESREDLERLRAQMGEYNFSGQYQQAPVPLGGGMVKLEWFKTYLSSDLSEGVGEVIQSWDTACKEGELNDYSVCTTWRIIDRRLYLLDVFRQRLGFPALERAVKELADLFGPSTILIEEKASGIQLLQQLRHDGVYAVTGIKPEGDKTMRMHAQTATIERGAVFLPQEAPWLASYVAEVTSFNKGKFDDQVDSTSQALWWVNSLLWKPGMNLMRYMQEEAAKRKF